MTGIIRGLDGLALDGGSKSVISKKRRGVRRSGKVAGNLIVLLMVALILPSLALPKGEIQAQEGRIIHVDVGNTAGPWEGTQEHPYRTIRDGTNAASSGDIVQAAGGTYTPDTGETFPIEMKSGVALRGAGRDDTILDARADADNEKSVVVFDNTESATIEGFTIRGGYAGEGAGILVQGEASEVIVTDCIALDNTGIWGAGGIGAVSGAEITILNSIISNNTGPGIGLSEAEGRILSNTISGNSREGIYFHSSLVSVGGNLIEANQDYGGIDGGEGSHFLIQNNTIRDNVGGGINIQFDVDAASIIRRNLIVGNTQTANGSGIFCNYNASPTVVNNTLSENSGGVRRHRL